MVKLKFLGVVLFSLVVFASFVMSAATSMADQGVMPAEGPSWEIGDWWIVEQTKMDIASPTPHWKEPLRWRCEVKGYPDDPNLFVLEIRSASGLKTGMDVVYGLNPWVVKKIRKLIATADGIKAVEREINSSGPVMALNSPFSLVLPGFPLENTTSSYVVGANPNPLRQSSGASRASLQDSGSGGQIVGVQYNLKQEVSFPGSDDPLMIQGEAVASGMKGNASGGMVAAASKVAITMGRKKAVQLWNKSAPWALVEETPRIKTTLIESHKGVTP